MAVRVDPAWGSAVRSWEDVEQVSPQWGEGCVWPGGKDQDTLEDERKHDYHLLPVRIHFRGIETLEIKIA